MRQNEFRAGFIFFNVLFISKSPNISKNINLDLIVVPNCGIDLPGTHHRRTYSFGSLIC